MREDPGRRAENERRFRTANEQIEEKAVELGIRDSVPFLCECSDETCREILLLSVEGFREIRKSSARFVLAHGHESGSEDVVERRDGSEVVEKRGEEARLVEEGRARPDEAEA